MENVWNIHSAVSTFEAINDTTWTSSSYTHHNRSEMHRVLQSPAVGPLLWRWVTFQGKPRMVKSNQGRLVDSQRRFTPRWNANFILVSERIGSPQRPWRWFVFVNNQRWRGKAGHGLLVGLTCRRQLLFGVCCYLLIEGDIVSLMVRL